MWMLNLWMAKMKNLIKKTSEDIKADTNAVFNAIDLASGGFLSSTKESIANVYRGYLESKFNNLIVDVIANNVSQDELLSFINSSSEKDREFLCNIILKNIHADNRLTTFILAKLWASRIVNGKLNYYESSLSTNINSLTLEDFEVFYEIWSHKTTNEKGYYYFQAPTEKEFYVDIQNKLFGMGIIEKPNAFSSNFANGEKQERKMCAFGGTGFSEYLFELLKEYFKENP